MFMCVKLHVQVNLHTWYMYSQVNCKTVNNSENIFLTINKCIVGTTTLEHIRVVLEAFGRIQKNQIQTTTIHSQPG
jgi:hypothetical protein